VKPYRCMGGGSEPVRERVSRARGSGAWGAAACGEGAEGTFGCCWSGGGAG